MWDEYKINSFPSAAHPALKVLGLQELIASCLGAKARFHPGHDTQAQETVKMCPAFQNESCPESAQIRARPEVSSMGPTAYDITNVTLIWSLGIFFLGRKTATHRGASTARDWLIRDLWGGLLRQQHLDSGQEET